MDTPIEQNYAPHQLQTASRARRFSAALIDGLLMAFWLAGANLVAAVLASDASEAAQGAIYLAGLGAYLVFRGIYWRNGQTPAKSMLNLYYIRRDGYRAGGRFTFLRDILLPWLISVAFLVLVAIYTALGLDFLAGSTLISSLLADAWLLWDPDRQTLTDKILHTYVAHAPQGYIPTTKAEGIPLPGPELAPAATTPTAPDVLLGSDVLGGDVPGGAVFEADAVRSDVLSLGGAGEAATVAAEAPMPPATSTVVVAAAEPAPVRPRPSLPPARER